jgi:hypothetical protein
MNKKNVFLETFETETKKIRKSLGLIGYKDIRVDVISNKTEEHHDKKEVSLRVIAELPLGVFSDNGESN